MSRTVAILADKNLSSNTRVERQVRALSAAGWEVRVFCLAPARDSLHPESYTPLRMPRLESAKAMRSWLARLAGDGRRRTQASAPKTASMAEQAPPRPSLVSRLAFPASYVLESIVFCRAVERAARGMAFDVVQAHDHVAVQAAHALARRSGAALVYDAVELPYTMTEVADEALLRPLARWLMAHEAALLRGARILTVGPGIAGLIRGAYGSAQPEVVRNCSLFREDGPDGTLRADLGLASGDVLVLYLNSVLPGRGLRTLAAAAPALPPNVHFAVLGPKPDANFHQELLVALRAAGVAGRFHFPDLVPATRVVAYASGADVGVVPSRDWCRNLRHSLPNRLFEMVMARLPLVCSDLPDIAALVREHALGEVFRSGDPNDLARALAAMLDPATRKGHAESVARAAQTLCWEKESERYAALMDSLTTDR